MITDSCTHSGIPAVSQTPFSRSCILPLYFNSREKSILTSWIKRALRSTNVDKAALGTCKLGRKQEKEANDTDCKRRHELFFFVFFKRFYDNSWGIKKKGKFYTILASVFFSFFYEMRFSTLFSFSFFFCSFRRQQKLKKEDEGLLDRS